RALGQRVAEPEEGRRAIAEAKAQLPLVPGALESMSVATILRMLDNPDAALGLAHLYRAESLIELEQGQLTAAERAGKRALQFFAAADTQAISEEDATSFRALSDRFSVRL
ncbi:MAG TPA: hypothetical protein VGI70_15875, partial [Polyangiales bacterium]